MGDLEATENAMRFAQVAGAPQLRVGVGRLRAGASYHDLFTESRAFLSAVEVLARRYGVKALVELHHGTICPSAALAHRLVSHFDPRFVGVIHDAGNMAHEGFEDYRLGLELLGPHLAHVHLKNAAFERPAGGGVWKPRWAPLEDGVVDFSLLLGALQAVGYDGWLVLEDLSAVRPSRGALRHNLAFVQRVIAKEAKSVTTSLRHVIIGVGAGVFHMHRAALELPTTRLVGVSDVNAEVGEARARELGCAFFSHYREMLAETQPEVAVILTPHPFHAAIAIDCLEAGCHVLVEKPMAVEASEADAMIETARRVGRLLAVNFQQRLRSEVLAAKRYLDEGRLGRVQHIDVTRAWPRTQSYYRSATWRATWRGEGGGVLLNQAPHDLDLMCYLLGMPKRVTAWTRNLLHATETEDTVQAMLEWVDGALGSLHISTAEGGRDERIEFVGTGGVMRVRPQGVKVERFEPDFAHYSETSPERFGSPERVTVELELSQDEGSHLDIYRNLHQAILEGVPLVCDGEAGRMSLELANAMILSSYTDKSVAFPLERAAYHVLLENLRHGANETRRDANR